MAYPRYTLRQLEAFTALAEVLSFNVAAGRMARSPSAVSQLIAELEAVTGFSLFDRDTRNVTLSAAGTEFPGSAEAVLKYLRLAEKTATDIRDRAKGTGRVSGPQGIP